jgi:hypothetical protein
VLKSDQMHNSDEKISSKAITKNTEKEMDG